MPFELFVALRYLRARRKEAFISLITLISVAGVAIGVMALIVVISVMGGFENHLRTKILGINSHVIVKSFSGTIPNWEKTLEKIREIPLAGDREGPLKSLLNREDRPKVVAATPFCYIQALLSSGAGVGGALVRGIDPGTVKTVIDPGMVVIGKGLDALEGTRGRTPPIILGKELARTLGVDVGDPVQLVLPSGTVSPVGMLPKIRPFKVVGIITTGMYEYDASLAYVSLASAQRLLGLGERVHGLELKVSDIYLADKIADSIQKGLGYPFWTTDWQRMSRNLFSALKLEKLAMFIILTLIVLVAAFNIVSSLIMLVMEKHQDIAILKAIGATDSTILRIFMLNGLIIGVAGTVAGIVGGTGLCWLLARYKFIKIPSDVYFTDTLPILLKWQDVTAIGVCAVLICFAATIYPARQASRVSPSQALRTG